MRKFFYMPHPLLINHASRVHRFANEVVTYLFSCRIGVYRVLLVEVTKTTETPKAYLRLVNEKLVGSGLYSSKLRTVGTVA